MTAPSEPCQACGEGALEHIAEYAKLPRATSDSRPWPAGGRLAVCTLCGTIQKIPDKAWLDEIGRIYTGYDIYHQSAGSEQLIFGDRGQAEPRSRRLVDFVVREARLPATGKLLDIGCGNGAALRNFSGALSGWKLHGAELNDSTIGALRTIPGFAKLHTGSLTDIGERFSLVSLIHTLEHVIAPAQRLAEVVGLLDAAGVLFVEVPDIETSPFDLLVADHLLHFSPSTLQFLSAAAGLDTLTLSNTLIAKELTLLAKRGRTVVAPPPPERGVALAKKTVAWLGDVFASARSVAAKRPVAIFGTAIAGMALYGALRDSVAFFVDEDPHRIGREYDGKPVLAPATAPRDVPVYLPFPAARARAVAERCGAFGLECIQPPPIRVS